MTSLSDYENSLDELDKHLYRDVKRNGIQCDFGGGLFFPSKSISNPASALAIARKFSVMLLEEKDANVSYLSKRFLRLAYQESQPKKSVAEVDEEFRRHEFHHLTVERYENVHFVCDSSGSQLSFLGRLPQFFFRITRSQDSKNRSLEKLIKIERPAFADWHFWQVLHVEELQVTPTPSCLVFDLPVSLDWVDNSGGKLANWRQHDAMRVAVRHTLTSDEVQSVIAKLAEVCDGLTLRVEPFDDLKAKYQSENFRS